MTRWLGYYSTSGSLQCHVRFLFSTHESGGGNVAPSSAFEAADIRIYQAGIGAAYTAFQRGSSSGITVTSPFDSLTGVHAVDIDLTDNSDAGFYLSGSRYTVVLAPDETVDSQTITGIVLGEFEIGFCTADLMAVKGLTNTATNIETVFNTDFSTAYSTVRDMWNVNVEYWNATSVPAEHTAGYPIVTIKDGTGTGEINTNAGKVVGVELVDVLTTYTGNTVQTGDSYAIVNSGTHGNAAIKGYVDDIGVAGAGLTALGDTRIANLDATVSSRSTLTQAQVTGGAYALNSASFSFNAALDLTTTQKASVNTEADTALADYDGPTNAEMEARTLLAASYATAANQATIIGYIDTEVAAILAAVDTEVAAIKAKTDNLPSDPADQSAVEAAITAATANLDAAVSTRATPAQVNSEVVDAFATDTYAEPTGTPGATLSLSEKISWLFMALRNKLTVSGTKKQFYDDAGNVEWEKDLSDDGTTYTETEANDP
jgi:hypothetical protein